LIRCGNIGVRAVGDATWVPDPYRWLEDPDSADTTAWVSSQVDLYKQFWHNESDQRMKYSLSLSLAHDDATEYWSPLPPLPSIHDIELRDKIKSQLQEMYDYEKFSCPFKRGDRYFYYRNSGLQNQSVLYSQDALDKPATVCI
jgi:prolyl oligopeptidase